ncbi:hypothetical protein EVG20_g2011 [Dentipellis fragilis]|uniref:Uncharacterized protein n=1 Tax=Dentipellis fragilis TaxID=205917 RepID=A0A4Y9Z7Z2_9AGAM|nr:hypothetical protein EVG20_g2011 [Dentipellis fragilis]
MGMEEASNTVGAVVCQDAAGGGQNAVTLIPVIARRIIARMASGRSRMRARCQVYGVPVVPRMASHYLAAGSLSGMPYICDISPGETA